MLEKFIHQFTNKPLPSIQIGANFFLENKKLQQHRLEQKENYFGLYLGKNIKNMFIPSFCLLDLLAQISDEKVFVNDYGELDFLYGKHLRKRHIAQIHGKKTPDCLKLVQNKYNENLGYGIYIDNLLKSQQVIRHVLDRGIFLKRDIEKEQG